MVGPSVLTRLTGHPWVVHLVVGVAWFGGVLALGFPWPVLVGATVVVASFVCAGLAWLPGDPGERMRRYILGRSHIPD